MVQTFPANRADESLCVWILPWTLRCCENLLDAQRLDSQPNFRTVPAVAIADEILGSLSVCERLYDLLCGPSPGGMLGHIKVQHLATIMFEDNEYERHLHRDGRHCKEIGRHYLTDMVVQEGPPGLVRRATESAQDAGNSALGDRDAEHFEFAVNPGCAPKRISGDHLLDQSAEFCGGAGATWTPALRLGKPGPEFAEPLAMPTDDGVGLDVNQRMSPLGPQAAESDPKYPVPGCQQRALPFSLKRSYLHS